MTLSEGAVQTTTERPRIRSLDILKGAAILGVIIAHVAVVEDKISFSGNRFLGELFYSALPMFIVVSGYFHRVGRSFIENIKRRVLPILVAFVTGTVVLTIAMFLYLQFIGYDLSFNKMIQDIITILIGKGAFMQIPEANHTIGWPLGEYDVSLQMYYLQILIVGYTIFYAIVDKVIDDPRKVISAILLLVLTSALYMEFVHMQLPFYAQLGPMVAAFLLVGALFGKYRLAEKIESRENKKRFWIVFAVMGLFASAMILLFPTRMALIYSQFGDYGGWSAFPFMLISLSCGIFLYFAAALASKIPYLSGFMCSAGRYSYTLFVLHIFVAKLLISPFETIGIASWLPIQTVWQGILLAIATIAVIMSASYILYKLWDIGPRVLRSRKA